MIAWGDRTYCTSKECQDKCWRHEDNWEFQKDMRYSFIEKCPDEKC